MADAINANYCPNCTLPLYPPPSMKMPAARVEELLHRNYAPLDAELSALRNVVENTPAALRDLDSKIVQAKELLNNLRSERRQVQSHFEDAKSLLHPMRCLPNEILAEIFGQCILKEYDEEAPDSLDPRAAPWLLTRVSRRWRELAINSPRLWTYLLLDFDKHSGYITDYQCAYKVGVFSERSRGLPLTVYLGSEYHFSRHPVLPILEVSIPRWRSLQVDLPRSTLQCLSGNTFSMLQAVFLQYNTEAEWDHYLDVFKSARAPVLRSVEVPSTKPWRALKHVALPWSHLTTILSFRAFDVDGMKSLRTCTKLEQLDVDANILDIHTPIRNVVPLPNLRRLTINEGDGASGRSKEFFSALAVPALSDLTLKYDDKSVLHFPTSPFPLGNLTKLEILCEMNAHSQNTQHLLHFLKLTHRVESLRLHDFNLTVEFCDGLNFDKYEGGTARRLPCLHFLDIGKCQYSPTLARNPSPLLRMLISRLRDAPDSVHDPEANSQTTVGTGSVSNKRRHTLLKIVRLPHWQYILVRHVWQDVFPDLELQAES